MRGSASPSRATASRPRSSASRSTGSTAPRASSARRARSSCSRSTPSSAVDVEWDEETLERALRSGLEEAIADAEERGSIGGLEATILREVVSRAPLDWLIEGGGDLADLFGGIFDRR